MSFELLKLLPNCSFDISLGCPESLIQNIGWMFTRSMLLNSLQPKDNLTTKSHSYISTTDRCADSHYKYLMGLGCYTT